MRDIIGMVLAGGRVAELAALTLARPKAAVPFGGQYRIIDFALSNLMRADFERVGVLSLYRSSSLIDHLGVGEPWDMHGRGRGLKILPPYTDTDNSSWYRGTADAVYQNLHYIRRHAPRDVMVLSGDHIYTMDFRPLIERHRATDADLTMVVKKVDPAQGAGRFGFAELDGDMRVNAYEEKPAQPASPWASLTIYLFKAEALKGRVTENAKTGTSMQLYDEVLPAMVAEDKVYAFEHEGYWNYARSVDSYHQAHMDLLGQDPAIQLDDWGVRSRAWLRGLGDQPPCHLEAGAVVRDALLSPGSRVAGNVERSVLSPGVVVEAGAQVRDCVLLHDVQVGAGAELDRVILDKGVYVGAGARLGLGPVEGPNTHLPEALASGVALVGKNTRVPDGAKLGRNCVAIPELVEEEWPAEGLASGQCLGDCKGGES